MRALTIQANDSSSTFREYECSKCGNTMIIASEGQHYCACCSSPLDNGTPLSRAKLTASPNNNVKYVKCVSCDTVFTVDSEESSEELSASKYCVKCSSDSLVACNASGESIEEEDDYNGLPLDEYVENNDVKSNLEDGVLAKSEDNEDTAYTEMDASSFEELQWSALDTSDGEQTAMIASSSKTGNPIAIFRKKNAPESMQSLFAQSLFVSAFNEVAASEGLATAIKTFGGNYFSEKVLTAADIEKAALANLQSSAIPRLIDCCQIAVNGGVKGIYPDVYTSLQKSIVNELVASGVDRERASNAVASTFSLHGSELFGTIVAKAMELFVKPETVRAEAKALIMQASTSLGNSEQEKIRAAMEKPAIDFGVLNMTASDKSSVLSVEKLRRELF